ncbi:hypothetical protein [Nostocoides veronense]
MTWSSLPILRTGVAATLLAFTLAGCGSGNSASTAATAGASSTALPSLNQGSGQQATGRPNGASGRSMTGASGEVVALDGTTAQVRNERTGQVAVTWSTKTTFSETVAGKASDIKVGDCVTAVSTADGAAATSVRVSKPADDGTCTRGGFGRDGFPGGGMPGGGTGMPSDMPTDMPSGMPTDLPSGMPSGGPGGAGMGSFVTGAVTAVAADSITVNAMSFPGSPGSTASASATAATSTTESTSVALGSDTAITTTAAADAKSVKVGVCVTALGDTDSVGAVTATSVAISQPVDGACGSGGMGGFGGTRPGNGGTTS